MPKPSEVCSVVANGQTYNIWTTVEVECSYDRVIDHCMLTVAEITSPSAVKNAQKLKPGDRVKVSLGGVEVMDGVVYLRQASLTPENHAVQIGIASFAVTVNTATVEGKPGQYINQTAQAIMSALYGKIGINFSVAGSPEGASVIIPRFSEHVGETVYACAERVAKMVALHQTDDGKGGIVAFSGPTGGDSGLKLKEGFNIISGRLLLKNNDAPDFVQFVGMQATTDPGINHNPTATLPGPQPTNGIVPHKFIAEEAGDSNLMRLRAQTHVDFVNYDYTDGEIRVQGWFASDGSLWWTHGHRQELILLEAPSLVPGQSDTYMIKGIIHRQDNDGGTTTSVLLCDRRGMGSSQGRLE